MTYAITLYKRGRKRTLRYPTLAEAKEIAQKLFEQRGIVAGIESIERLDSGEAVQELPWRTDDR